MKYFVIYSTDKPPQFLTSWNVLPSEEYLTLNLYKIINEIPVSDTVMAMCENLDNAYDLRHKFVAMFKDRYLSHSSPTGFSG